MAKVSNESAENMNGHKMKNNGLNGLKFVMDIVFMGIKRSVLKNFKK